MKRKLGIGNGERETALRRRTSTRSLFAVPRSSARGFSLLEVIAAILLLAIAVGALMRVASASLNLADKLGQTTRADMLAQGKLDALGIAEPLTLGEREGVFDRDFRWHLRVAPWQGDDLPPDSTLTLYRVELYVLWGDARRPRELKYVTLRTVKKATP
ncbi:general secretion pathway protein I [Dyella sp. OK004]|uniref:prepilin-type N-terminal cleavage/methylation domain-containing protein n=1 Tax=Dyella sp. OK004 TaxID=1855292 RepID=UPI0008E9ED90|nr:prepilin-type N-terminal cleavage/methylation domain-containing protein [Dyella sp. OK004]SFS13507.1 general secretion pathway protein I [Dyella sp. OK004]